MPLTPSDIAQRAAEEAKAILGAAPGLAAQAAAVYVKEGTPSGPIPNVGVAIARQACRRYADGSDGLSGPVAAGFERVCRPYLDDIGYGSTPSLSKPFDGGQCPGVSYVVELTSYSASTGNLFNVVNVAGTGPVTVGPSGLQALPQGDPGCDPGLTFFPGKELRFNGVPVRSWGGGCSVRETVEVTNVSREDGNPDNCGNPPPVVTPPVGPPLPPTGPEPFSPSPGIDIDIDVDIGPTGPITINIGTGPIVIDPFGGDDGGDGGGDNPGIDQPGTAPSSGLPPGDIGAPAAPVETPPGGVANGCAPPNSVLVGIKINIMEPLPNVSTYDPLVYRGACYAYMGTVGNLALNPEGVALRNGQMLFAPLDNLTCWEVRANVGFILRVTPYYRQLEAQEV